MSEENKENLGNEFKDSGDNSKEQENFPCAMNEQGDYSNYYDQAEERKSNVAKAPKKISMEAFVITCFGFVALLLAAVMMTVTISSGFYRKKLAEAKMESAITGVTEDSNELITMLEALSQVFEQLSITDYDSEEMMNEVLKAYVRASGDRYAEYYTPEEYAELMQANTGTSQGIGINIIESTAVVDGTEGVAIKVINVTKDSPAEKAGIKVGDLIIYAGKGAERKAVSELGYIGAVAALQGEAGTTAEFTVRRFNGEAYEDIEFSVLREKFISEAVLYRVCSISGYENVGIVKIESFDLTTPNTLKNAMSELQGSGCNKFVFDVRYNPGGDLRSIEAVLSYFLNEGDTIIKTVDKSGTEEISKVKAVEYTDEYAPCSVKREEIGMYHDLDFVVLANGSTASAAELFTAALRDYELCSIVGTTTYGKGSMQSIIPLQYGLKGAVKLTTRMYYPPCGVSYEGIGIAPSPNCMVELSEEAQSYNIYDIPDEKDNQLVEAIKHIK